MCVCGVCVCDHQHFRRICSHLLALLFQLLFLFTPLLLLHVLLLLDLHHAHAVQPLVNLPPFVHRFLAHLAQSIRVHDLRAAALSGAVAANIFMALGTTHFGVFLSSAGLGTEILLQMSAAYWRVMKFIDNYRASQSRPANTWKCRGY